MQTVSNYRGYTIEQTSVGCDLKHPNGQYLLMKVSRAECERWVDAALGPK